ncbi:MAG: AAA family ATPase [Desulfobacterales bacterium]|nr:AAA family ATPase [Desulfobacterales bacterium]
MQFVKATKQMSKIKLAITGPAGSGKTYSALILAQSLKDNARIVLIDTEHGSAALYGDIFNFDICVITPPFEPKKYIESIKKAQELSYDIIIIDSLSHAWAGEGGLLDIHDKISKSIKNSYTAWKDVTPHHYALIEAILQANCHVISTLRTKTAYEIQKDDGGKTKPVKIGLAPVQRDGLEYEFTTVFDLSTENHIASVSKDRTGLFDGKYFVISQDTGKQIENWLISKIQTPIESSSTENKPLEVIEPKKSKVSIPTKKQIEKALQLLSNDIFSTEEQEKGNEFLETADKESVTRFIDRLTKLINERRILAPDNEVKYSEDDFYYPDVEEMEEAILN